MEVSERRSVIGGFRKRGTTSKAARVGLGWDLAMARSHNAALEAAQHWLPHASPSPAASSSSSGRGLYAHCGLRNPGALSVHTLNTRKLSEPSCLLLSRDHVCFSRTYKDLGGYKKAPLSYSDVTPSLQCLRLLLG